MAVWTSVSPCFRRLSITKLRRNFDMPSDDHIDLLVVRGIELSVLSEAEHRQRMRQSIEKNDVRKALSDVWIVDTKQ